MSSLAPDRSHIAQPAPSRRLAPLFARTEPTPHLVLDLDEVTFSYRRLASALPGVALHYAMKSNSDHRLLTHMAGLGGRFEVASATELDQLVAIGVDPASVLFSNPVKPMDHIRRAAEVGLWRFAFDSRAELDKLQLFAPGSAVFVRVAVDPANSEVPSEGKFGVDEGEAVALLQAARQQGLRPYGIAFHVGSQMLDPTAWRPALEAVGRIMRRLADEGITISMVDIGGGFPARYDTDVPSPSIFGAEVMGAIEDELPYEVDLVAEPGRALVATAGTLVGTVIGTADRRGRRWVHLDVGAFNGVMEALETQNELRFPLVDSLDSTDQERCHLTGPSCDSQDTLLFDVPLSRGLATGDKVAIGSAGAYTTAYASNFNGFDIPSTIVVGGNTVVDLR